MLFNSYDFLFYFLPITLLLFFCSLKFFTNKISLIVIFISSIIFYGNHNLNYLFLFIFSILVNFYIGQRLSILDKKSNISNLILKIGIIFNLVLLFIFKYFDFFSLNLSFFNLNIPSLNLILPIGISFYTFQQIGFLVDSYKGKSINGNLFEYATFVSFFPQLIAGPIVNHEQFIKQIKPSKYRPANYKYISTGIIIFIFGLFKKVVVADELALRVVEPFYKLISDGDLTSAPIAWISTISYSMQIYFDFSAYSEMAIGLGLLFGITLPINFDSPFQAKSLIDYWNRWNITLSNFISNYVYFPLFKKLATRSKNIFNDHIRAIIIAMTITGFWHGANWNCLLFGFIHGIGLSINHFYKSKKIKLKIPSFFLRILLLVFINLTFVIFKSINLKEIKLVLYSMIPFKTNLFNSFDIFNSYFGLGNIEFILLAILIIVTLKSPSLLKIMGYTSENKNEIRVDSIFKKFNLSKIHSLLFSTFVTLIFFLTIILIHRGQEFIYFQF